MTKKSTRKYPITQILGKLVNEYNRVHGSEFYRNIDGEIVESAWAYIQGLYWIHHDLCDLWLKGGDNALTRAKIHELVDKYIIDSCIGFQGQIYRNVFGI